MLNSTSITYQMKREICLSFSRKILTGDRSLCDHI